MATAVNRLNYFLPNLLPSTLKGGNGGEYHKSNGIMVPKGGVEPPWPQGPRDFESRASASSATSALLNAALHDAVANSSLSTPSESTERVVGHIAFCLNLECGSLLPL
jgi:hypothetical protein